MPIAFFFRQVGLDPDAQRTPVEAAALDRPGPGGFVSRGPLEDALHRGGRDQRAGVGARRRPLDGPLGLRGAAPGERLGEGGVAAEPGPGARIMVADASAAVAVLFGDVAPGQQAAAARNSARLQLFAVAVPGVPACHVEEALFGCAEALSDARGAR